MEPKDFGWVDSDGRLVKNFSFITFEEAIEFVNEVARIANEIQHYPELYIHDLNQVRISTITTETQSIEDNDIELIQRIEDVVDDGQEDSIEDFGIGM